MCGVSIKQCFLSQHFPISCKSNYCVSHHNQYQHLYNMILYDSILMQSTNILPYVYKMLILPFDCLFSAEYLITIFATNFCLWAMSQRIGLPITIQWNTGTIQNPYHICGSFSTGLSVLTIIRNFIYRMCFFFGREISWTQTSKRLIIPKKNDTYKCVDVTIMHNCSFSKILVFSCEHNILFNAPNPLWSDWFFMPSHWCTTVPDIP